MNSNTIYFPHFSPISLIHIYYFYIGFPGTTTITETTLQSSIHLHLPHFTLQPPMDTPTLFTLYLLLHVPHADRADKHGVTPEMLAKNNWRSTAEAWRECLENKDRDLGDELGRENELHGRFGYSQESRGNGCISSSPLTTCLITSKRIPTWISIRKCWLIRGGSLPLQNQHRLLTNICSSLPNLMK
jgi:hypothetical protein